MFSDAVLIPGEQFFLGIRHGCQQFILVSADQSQDLFIFFTWVNCSGSAIAFGCLEDQYDALLQAWYPGQGDRFFEEED